MSQAWSWVRPPEPPFLPSPVGPYSEANSWTYSKCPLLKRQDLPPQRPRWWMGVYLFLQRNKTHRICVHIYREKEIYFKGLAHMIWRQASPKSAGRRRLAGWRSREELMLPFKSKSHLLAGKNSHSFGGKWWRSIFCSILAFYWLDEAHPYYGGQSALFKIHWFTC